MRTLAVSALLAATLCSGYRPLPARGSARVRASVVAQAGGAAAAPGGGYIDGARIGPPPDMPSLLLNNRIVYLGMPINSQVAELVISELLFLQYDSSEKPVLMYINSPGTTTDDGFPVGAETEAFAIADTMGYIKSPVHTVLVGKAYGLAAMLLASGEKGKRSSLPYGTVMIHQPRGQQMSGQASDIAIKAKEVLLNRKIALDMMSEATGVSFEKLEADTNRCKYMTAEAAREYGIIDTVVDKTPREALLSAADTSSMSRGLG